MDQKTVKSRVIITASTYARRMWPVAFIVCAMVLLAPGPTNAKTLATDLQVNAGKWSLVRLRQVPRNGQLDVTVRSDGVISLMLVEPASDSTDETALSGDATVLHRSEVSGEGSFALTIPRTGDYYLILDNRTGQVPRAVHVTASVSDGAASGAPANSTTPGTLPHAISSLEAKLRLAFVFDEMQIDVSACGHANAYSGPKRVLICAEHIARLKDELGETQKVRDALLFTLLHEIGHVMLRQWSYPFYDNEEVADEIATAIMVMFNESRAVRTQAKYFATIPSQPEADKKQVLDDRHPLSVQRARNILGWLDDPDFVSKWQTVLVPHMQTTLLETLAKSPQPWTSPDLVAQELSRRN